MNETHYLLLISVLSLLALRDTLKWLLFSAYGHHRDQEEIANRFGYAMTMLESAPKNHLAARTRGAAFLHRSANFGRDRALRACDRGGLFSYGS